ncbi:hypothetical protein M405DRAFT_808799 [Rhizopogon salebrosus TDB-379]|nr:hypothetical protein M405DRAFT_808799 [Rhizopogon salebrosus TDB-379]
MKSLKCDLPGLVFRRERERWSLTTALYLITRYLVLAPNILLSDAVSGIVKRLFSWGMVLLTYTMHAIMAIRVFAMYRRSRKMGLFLILCFMAASASRGVTDGLALSPSSGSISEEYILSGTGVCILFQAVVVPYLDGIPSICIELLFFVLAARVFYKHVLEMQRTLPDWGLDDCLSILFRDHLLHFFCYLTSNVMQIVIISMNGNSEGSWWYSSITIFFGTIQQCVLVPRLVISIREYNSQLSHGLDGATTDIGTMAFANNPNGNTTSA